MDKIPFMKPYMPPVEELLPYLEKIWESKQLTNGGAVHLEFESALCDYLGVKYINLFANGTLALVIALKVLNIKGEVITTPFTSPATLQAIYWNGLKPVFVDINDYDLNINVSLIEEAITPETVAILPVHIFGTPCDVFGIEQLARKHKIKVVYDSAHCFGVKLNEESVLNFGDLSVISFHATKVFNTFEGGAIVCHDVETKIYIDALKNTGLGADHKLKGYGLNAKLNEIQSAFGLCQLKHIKNVVAGRRHAFRKYSELLREIGGLRCIEEIEGVSHNYSYFPIIIAPKVFKAGRDELFDYLQNKGIITRKYFYPLVSDYSEFSLFKTVEMPVAQAISSNILCLPLYHDITDEQINRVVQEIKSLA